ncbi:N-acetylglucosamine kinase [Acetobacter lambici]|uniref:N-acetylglucosamine kinase n=1 Tax=Acetobacter lambici TaxID=1332824 RepID=UPI0014075540|nr:BadF/BadG/BcrA/BcrD ATPase family protein [Acetobacter lambici]NHO56705.1 N-acetylglucosamine kinase [Acetobacter lambici]
MPQTQTILALDGGGTHTRVALITRHDARVLAHATGPGCNPYDRAEWANNLHTLLRALPHTGLCAAVLGMAGYDAARPSSHQQRDVARAALGPDIPLELENDVQTAHRGAFAGGAGVFVLAGTGSVAQASTQDGRTTRAGGWGWLFGDEGGGYWIGCRALNHAARFLDDPDVTFAPFARAVLHTLGLPTQGANAPDALREWLRTREHPRSAVGDVATTVHSLATAHDPHALAILHAAGTHLAELARTACHGLGTGTGTGTGTTPEHASVQTMPDLPWSYGGSVMNNPLVRARVAAMLGQPATPPTLPPLGGAALRAAQLAGWEVDAAWVHALSLTLLAQKTQP